MAALRLPLVCVWVRDESWFFWVLLCRGVLGKKPFFSPKTGISVSMGFPCRH